MKWGDGNVVVATRMTTRSFSLVARFFLLCFMTSFSAVVADDSGSSTSSSTIAPMKYYYGNDNASVLPWETVTVLVLLFLFAVVLEYGLATLKDQEGTYTRIVAASVLQETLIIGLVSMFLLGLLTVVGIQPLYVLCVRSTSAGLILMVFVFIILILLLTAGLVWSRKVWGVFERSRMAAENIRGGIRYRRKAGDEEEIVNRDDDDVDEEDDAKRRGHCGKVLLSAAPLVENQEYHVSAAVRRYVQPSTTLVRRTMGSNYHDDDDLDDDHHNLGTTRTSMSMLDMHTPSRFQSPGAQSPRTPASPSAGGGQIPLSSRMSGGGGGGGRSGEGGGLVHRPLPLSATRAPLVLPYDMMDAAEQEAVDRELADALIGDGPIMMLMAAQRGGGGGGGGNGDGGGTMRRRRMFGFSSREKIFTRCRDLWMETIIRKRLLNRQQSGSGATAADIRDDDHMVFTDYVWKLMPTIMSLQADLGWKAWLVLALFVVVDGVRAVIVLGDNNTVTTEVLLTSVGSFVFLGGLLPLICFLLLMFRVQSGVDRFSRKPLMRQHEREARPTMAGSRHELFFGELEASITIFQMILLVFEWYAAFFYLNFSQPIVDEYGSVAFLFFLGALVPVVIYLTQMPWTLTMLAILSGIGSDLDVEAIQSMKDDLRLARGELTEAQRQQLDAYERDLPGEWSTNRGAQEAGTGVEVDLMLHRSSRERQEEEDEINNAEAKKGGEEGDHNGEEYLMNGPVKGVAIAEKVVVIAPKPPPQTTRWNATGDNQAAAPTTSVKAPPAAFFSFLPPDRILPGEESYFHRFASQPAAHHQQQRQARHSSTSGGMPRGVPQASGAVFFDSDEDDDDDDDLARL